MTDDALKQACEEFLGGTGCIPKTEELMAFARRMQAVGIREAKAELLFKADRVDSLSRNETQMVKDITKLSSDALRSIADWCEAEARKLEDGK